MLDELLDGVETQGDLLGPGGLLKQLSKHLLEDELTDHLGYEKYALCGWGTGNSRNGNNPLTFS